MTQKEEIKALREEVAELRKQITALLDIERIIARQPQVIPYPYQPPTWPTPWITYTSPNVCGQIGVSESRVPAVWNTGAAN